jgi:Ca-activated chloride channel homolog
VNKALRILLLTAAFCLIPVTGIAQEKPKPARSPLALGLLVDNSGSLRSDFAEVIQAAKEVVETSQPEDEIFVVRFIGIDKIEFANDFTNERSVLIRSLGQMYIEAGRSAITDALYVSAEHLVKKRSESYRRALIVITDGAEENSHYRIEKLLTLLKENKIPVYVIGFQQALARQGSKVEKRAKKYVDRLVEESGGSAYFPKTFAELKIITNEMMKSIQSDHESRDNKL